MLATANLTKTLGASAPADAPAAAPAAAGSPAAAGGTKRSAEGDLGEQEAKRQEVA